MENFERHVENIKTFAIQTMLNSKRMYRLLSNEFEEGINENTLYGYHSVAYSNYIGMKVYYLQNDILEHEEFEDFFNKFDQFNREFLSSRETNHSMQWTFGYYGELVESFNELAGLLNLNKFDVPQ